MKKKDYIHLSFFGDRRKNLKMIRDRFNISLPSYNILIFSFSLKNKKIILLFESFNISSFYHNSG